ncbi:MAG: hypothetical protein ACM3NO_08960 [Deltaproteobacteria bacterium]
MKLRRVDIAHDASQVNDRADVRAVKPAPRQWRPADRSNMFGERTRSQRGDHGLRVRVVENQLVGIMRQARHLLFGGPIKTLAVNLDVQAARQQQRACMEGFGISDLLDVLQVSFEARAVQAEAVKVLSGAHKGSGLALDCRAQGGKIATRFRSKKDQRLTGAFWNGYVYPFFAHIFRPGFGAEKPSVRRGIGGATKERHDQEITHGLVFRHFGMDPQAVSRAQVRDLRDRQRLVAAHYLDLHLRADQIEGVGFRAGRLNQKKLEQDKNPKRLLENHQEIF